MYGTATPYIASYLLLRKEGKIAFVLRSNTGWMNNHYGLPSGKVEKDESFSAAAKREGYEEAGITIDESKLRFAHAMHRLEGDDWVDMYFEVPEYEGEAYNAEPDVHGELVWLDPGNLPENMVPSVRYALQQIKLGKTYSEYGWNPS